MIQTGLFSVYNCGVPLHYAVDIKPDYAGIAVFELPAEGTATGMAGIMAWADLLEHLGRGHHTFRRHHGRDVFHLHGGTP